MIALDLPCLPPSVNKTKQARVSKTGKVYMVGGEDAKQFALVVLVEFNRQTGLYPYRPIAKGARLKVEAWFTCPTWRFDVDGPVKCLIDALAQAIGFNDLRVVDLVAHKAVKRGERHTYVEVSEVEKGGNRP